MVQGLYTDMLCKKTLYLLRSPFSGLGRLALALSRCSAGRNQLLLTNRNASPQHIHKNNNTATLSNNNKKHNQINNNIYYTYKKKQVDSTIIIADPITLMCMILFNLSCKRNCLFKSVDYVIT